MHGAPRRRDAASAARRWISTQLHPMSPTTHIRLFTLVYSCKLKSEEVHRPSACDVMACLMFDLNLLAPGYNREKLHEENTKKKKNVH